MTKVLLFRHVVSLLIKATPFSAGEQKQHHEARVESHILLLLIRQGDWRRSDRLIFNKMDLCLHETVKQLWMNVVPDISLLINSEKVLKFIYSSFINNIITRHGDSPPPSFVKNIYWYQFWHFPSLFFIGHLNPKTFKFDQLWWPTWTGTQRHTEIRFYALIRVHHVVFWRLGTPRRK